MHFADTLTVAVTLFLSAHSVQAQAIRPYKDAQCTEPVTDYKVDGNSPPESIWDNTAGWPQVSRYHAPTFPRAEAKVGGGYNVYWKIDQPGPGCRVAIMAPYGQTMYGSMSFQAPPGNVVLMAGKAGCYFSSIPREATDLSSTFCCGTGDCAPLSVGNAALLKREDTSLSLFSRTSAAISKSIVSIFFPTQPYVRLTISQIPRRTSTSLTGKAALYKTLKARDDFDARDCKTTVVGSPFPQAGQQTMVANPQHCDFSPCTFAISHGLTVSTSFGTSQDQTVTNTVGGSIAVKTGVNFIVEADVTATVEYSWATAASKGTSTDITNGTTVTVTNTLGQQPGTYAFVTFTPTYLCWMTKVNCGGEDSQAMNFCQPQMGGDGKLLQGDYTVVYTG